MITIQISLSPQDHEQLKQIANEKRLSLSATARMIIVDSMNKETQ